MRSDGVSTMQFKWGLVKSNGASSGLMLLTEFIERWNVMMIILRLVSYISMFCKVLPDSYFSRKEHFARVARLNFKFLLRIIPNSVKCLYDIF